MAFGKKLNESILLFFAYYSGRDASHPEICLSCFLAPFRRLWGEQIFRTRDCCVLCLVSPTEPPHPHSILLFQKIRFINNFLITYKSFFSGYFQYSVPVPVFGKSNPVSGRFPVIEKRQIIWPDFRCIPNSNKLNLWMCMVKWVLNSRVVRVIVKQCVTL
jgi:hypothetical protein